MTFAAEVLCLKAPRGGVAALKEAVAVSSSLRDLSCEIEELHQMLSVLCKTALLISLS